MSHVYVADDRDRPGGQPHGTDRAYIEGVGFSAGTPSPTQSSAPTFTGPGESSPLSTHLSPWGACHLS